MYYLLVFEKKSCDIGLLFSFDIQEFEEDKKDS